MTFLKDFFEFVHLLFWEREREYEQGERQRGEVEGERENLKQTLLCAQSPTWGLISQYWVHDLSQNQELEESLTDCATQAPLIFFFIVLYFFTETVFFFSPVEAKLTCFWFFTFTDVRIFAHTSTRMLQS